jgi:hypothetical protein
VQNGEAASQKKENDHAKDWYGVATSICKCFGNM